MTTTALASRHCIPRTTALADAALAPWLAQVPGWAIENGKLCKSYTFHDYYETLAFVNALAYMTHAQDHHPELAVTYNACVIRYDTHSVNQGKGGLSENDFICAARADAMYDANAHANAHAKAQANAKSAAAKA